MDFCDKATEREEFEREYALEHIRNAPQRDYEHEVCDGCQYATKSNYGRACEVWRECLVDLQKRDGAERQK